jgi:hypothetical protein
LQELRGVFGFDAQLGGLGRHDLDWRVEPGQLVLDERRHTLERLQNDLQEESFPSLAGGRDLGHLAGLDAAGARVDTAGRSVDDGTDPLNVGVEPALRPLAHLAVERALAQSADTVAEAGAFSADLTD